MRKGIYKATNWPISFSLAAERSVHVLSTPSDLQTAFVDFFHQLAHAIKHTEVAILAGSDNLDNQFSTQPDRVVAVPEMLLDSFLQRVHAPSDFLGVVVSKHFLSHRAGMARSVRNRRGRGAGSGV